MKKNVDYNLAPLTNEDAISYYLLGVFCTDGCLNDHRGGNSKTVSFSSIDYDWVVDIKNLFSKNINVYKPKNKNAYAINLNNRDIYNWFNEHGCTPRKTKTLKFPKVPKQFIPDFIRGCMDGDGSIGIYNMKTKFKNSKFKSVILTLTTASKFFAKEFRKNIKLAGINTPKLTVIRPEDKKHKSFIEGREIKNKSIIYVVRITGYEAEKLLQYIYYSDNVFCLKRKQNKANIIFNYFANHKRKIFHATPNREDLVSVLKTTPIKHLAKKLKMTNKVIYRWMHILDIPKQGFALRDYKGSNNISAKLTEPEIKIIKKEVKKGTHKAILAKRFGVHEHTIRTIANGKTWKHVKI